MAGSYFQETSCTPACLIQKEESDSDTFPLCRRRRGQGCSIRSAELTTKPLGWGGRLNFEDVLGLRFTTPTAADNVKAKALRRMFVFTTRDVVVIGGGVAGCATAYFLAKEGVKVTLLERESIGCGSSGFAAGLLNPLGRAYTTGSMEPLAQLAYKMHRELWPLLQEESGVDIQATVGTSLKLCFTEGEAQEQQQDMKGVEGAEGFCASWLDSHQVHALEPRLAEDVLGALRVEGIGVLDSYRYTLALAQAAERHGATIRHGVVTGLRSSGGRVSGVVLGQDVIPCDSVVLAMGPWTGEASSWLGVTLPVRPLKGEIIYLEPLAPSLNYLIHGSQCLIIHKKDGKVWVASTEEEAGFNDETTTQARDLLIQKAVRMMPCLNRLRIVHQTACLRPIAPDRLPIIGSVPEWEGLYVATAGEKKGILISPAMGRAVADLILTGRTSVLVGPFSLERLVK